MRVVARTDAEFVALVNSEQRGAIAAAAFIVGSRSVAEEIVQDVFERAYGRWARVGSIERPGAWIRRAVINQAISTARRSRNERRALGRLGEGVVIELSDVAHVVDSGLWAAVAELPSNQATAVALHYGADLSLEEVARELGLSQFAVKSLLHRARVALRANELLKEEVP